MLMVDYIATMVTYDLPYSSMVHVFMFRQRITILVNPLYNSTSHWVTVMEGVKRE